MFDSFVPYVLMAVATVMLLVVILWPRKKQEKPAKQAEKLTDEMRKGYDAGIAIVKRLELPKRHVKRMGVLTIDTPNMQICEKCMAAWIGELVRSGKCERCGGKLHARIDEGYPPTYVVVSEERLERLLEKLLIQERMDRILVKRWGA